MRLTINQVPVEPVLAAVRLERSRADAAAALTAVLWTAEGDTYFQKLSLALGDVVRLTDDDGAERFVGSVHLLERTPRQVTLTAFDAGICLSRNEVRGVFAGTGGEICRQVAARLGIPTGTLEADAAYRLIAAPRGENAFSVLCQAAGGGRVVAVEGGVLTVRRTGDTVYALAPERVTEVSAAADIRSMVNRVQVVDRKGTVLATAENSADRAAYGLFQQILGSTGADTASQQARQALSGRSMTARVALRGDAGLPVGSRITAALPGWGLEGLYTVTAVLLIWEAGDVTTELTLEGET